MEMFIVILSSTVVASVISGTISLIVSKRNYAEKRLRVLCIFENYIASAAKAIQSKTDTDIESYSAEFVRCGLYVIDEEIYIKMKELNRKIISKNMDGADGLLEEIMAQYAYKYNLSEYKSKKRNRINTKILSILSGCQTNKRKV